MITLYLKAIAFLSARITDSCALSMLAYNYVVVMSFFACSYLKSVLI